jgi:hypothetical protein
VGLRHIAAAKPSWFVASKSTNQEIVGTATIELPEASKDFVIDVRVACSDKDVFAYEVAVGTRLPPSCPERHINENGSFCLGFGAQSHPTDRDSASIWWGLLWNFLKLQHVASRSRSWPQRQALSHGNEAGAHHLQALEAARSLGSEEDYYRMLEGEKVWLSNPFLRVSKTGDRLCNGRRPCPKGCRRRDEAPVLRRDCDKKRAMALLVFHESKRRKAERQFWETWIDNGGQCCGSMRHCPAREIAAEKQDPQLKKGQTR